MIFVYTQWRTQINTLFDIDTELTRLSEFVSSIDDPVIMIRVRATLCTFSGNLLYYNSFHEVSFLPYADAILGKLKDDNIVNVTSMSEFRSTIYSATRCPSIYNETRIHEFMMYENYRRTACYAGIYPFWIYRNLDKNDPFKIYYTMNNNI